MVLKSVVKPAVIFSVPITLNVVRPSSHHCLTLNILTNVIAVPVNYVTNNLITVCSNIRVGNRPIRFAFTLVLVGVVPIVVITVLITLKLGFVPRGVVGNFRVFTGFLITLVALNLTTTMIGFLLN